MATKKSTKKKASKKKAPSLRKAIDEFHIAGRTFLRTAAMRHHSVNGKPAISKIKDKFAKIEKRLKELEKISRGWK